MGFTPSERPRIAVANDGTLAAIHEPARVSVLEMPGCAPFTEVDIDPEASASDVAWVGAPPRLLVLSRYAAHSTVLLLDPYGPRTIAEIRLESPMKLFGTVGNHALAVGAGGAAVLTVTDQRLTPYQFPARSVPTTAGTAGSQFVVALPGAIEEWEPASRMPKRRLKLPRPAAITALGGSDRVVWMTTQQEPARIDVIPLVNRGQPRAHDLPEPIAHVSGHPRGDLLACIGADSGRLYIVDLDGRSGLRVVGPEGIARVEAAALVVGRVVGVLAAQARHEVALVPLDPREREPAPVVTEPVTRVDPEPSKRSTLTDDDEDEPPRLRPAPTLPPPRAGHAVPAAIRPSSSDRRATWRDETVAWYRAVAAGSTDRDGPILVAIDCLIGRLDIAPQLHAALVLLYGAHLAGDGAAPVDVARVLGHDWNEALGKGQLAARGITVHDGSRVRLARPIQRALDELPPETGTLVGEPGTVSLLGPCAVVADRAVRLVELAPRFIGAVGGAILVGDGLIDILEAQVRGAVPMMRTDHFSDIPMIVVADSEPAADRLGLPRID